MRRGVSLVPVIMILTFVILVISSFFVISSLQDRFEITSAGDHVAALETMIADRSEARAFLARSFLMTSRNGSVRLIQRSVADCGTSSKGIGIYDDADCLRAGAPFESVASSAVSELEPLLAAHPSAVYGPVSGSFRRSSNTTLIEVDDLLVPARADLVDLSSRIDNDNAPAHVTSIAASAPMPASLLDLDVSLGSDMERAVRDAIEADVAYCENDPFKAHVFLESLRSLIESCPQSDASCECGSIRVPEDYRLQSDDGVLQLTGSSDKILPSFETDAVTLLDADGGAVARIRFDGDEELRVYRHIESEEDGFDIEDAGAFLVAEEAVSAGPTPICRAAIVPPEPQRLSYLPLVDGVRAIDSLSGPTDESGIVREWIADNTDPNEPIVIIAPDASLDQQFRIEASPSLSEAMNLLAIGVTSDPAFTYPSTCAEDSSGVALEGRSVQRGAFGSSTSGTATILESVLPERDVIVLYHPVQIPSCTPGPGSAVVGASMVAAPITPIAEDLFALMEESVRIAANRQVQTREVCVDRPFTEFVLNPKSGTYGPTQVYPYVSVPTTAEFVWPLERLGDFEQCWGPALSSTAQFYGYHKGVDLQPPGVPGSGRTGTGVFDRYTNYPVVSAFDGTIVYYKECPVSIYTDEPMIDGSVVPEDQVFEAATELCGFENEVISGLGEHLIIQSDDGRFRAVYGHLAPGSIREAFNIDPTTAGVGASVQIEGREVSAGQPIGYVGNTGLSTGAHLHFEMFDTTSEDFAQFNPFCVLPQTKIEDGVEFDISEKFRAGSTTVSDVLEVDDTDHAPGFVLPASDRENCFFNYVMAYYDHNPRRDTYGVCPAGVATQARDPIVDDDAASTDLPNELNFVGFDEEGEYAEFMLIVNRETFTSFDLSAYASLVDPDGDESPVSITIDNPGLHSQNRGAILSIPLPTDDSGEPIHGEYTARIALSFDGAFNPSPSSHEVSFEAD